MLLLGKPVVTQLTLETKQRLQDNDKLDGYVAIFLCSDDRASEVYVTLKSKYAKKLGIYADIHMAKDRSAAEIEEEIQQCNTDPRCLGILVQLPLATDLQPHQTQILDSIDPSKDIDGLTSRLFGQAGFGREFLGATPQAAMHILDHYDMGDVRGKVCMLISQSNLIGKPLALELMKRGATVISTNSKTSTKVFEESFGLAEYVFAATGVKHLISRTLTPTPPTPSPLPKGEGLGESKDFHVPLSDKVLVDIGRGSDEDGPHGDVDLEWFQDKVRGVTPVPGGVGPVTVATLFHNIIKLG